MQKGIDRANFCPEIIVSDGLQWYKRACKKVFGRKTRNVVLGKEDFKIDWTVLFQLRGNITWRARQPLGSRSQIVVWTTGQWISGGLDRG